MNVPAAVAAMCAEQGGVIEGDAKSGTWWRDGLRGRPTLSWKKKRDGTYSVVFSPKQ